MNSKQLYTPFSILASALKAARMHRVESSKELIDAREREQDLIIEELISECKRLNVYFNEDHFRKLTGLE